jgi:ubiquinone/menaquinone biosynthesis C-methylase UbiE
VAYLQEKHRLRALGVDVSGGLFRNDGSTDTIPVALARAEELPLPDGRCDGVLCECVLSLLKEPRQAVGEFSRVLRPGGFLILSDIYDRSADTVAQNESTSCGSCASALQSRPFVEKLLGDAGFRLRAWEDHTRYLKELAAQLILSSESLTEFHNLCGVFNTGCTSPSGALTVRPGYYLLVAQKTTRGEAFHG